MQLQKLQQLQKLPSQHVSSQFLARSVIDFSFLSDFLKHTLVPVGKTISARAIFVEIHFN